MKNLKKSLLTAAAAAVALATVPSLALAGTCGEVLANAAFDCTHANEAGGNYTSCVEFGTVAGNGEFPVTMMDSTSFTGNCSCTTKGNVTAPVFDVGTAFTCVTNSTIGGDLAFTGKASPGKIKKGETTGASGFSSIFTCVQRETACP